MHNFCIALSRQNRNVQGSYFDSKNILEKSGDNSVIIHIYVQCGWHFRKSGHCHYVACENHDKSCAGIQLNIFHREHIAFRRSDKFRVVAYGILRFCDADRKISITLRFKFLEFLDR